MHEYSIARALLDRVAAEVRSHGATRVLTVDVKIGEASGVEPELLETAFAIAREGTACTDAVIRIVRVPLRWECPDCGREPAGPEPRCETCGRPARLASGDEILLERLELEVP